MAIINSQASGGQLQPDRPGWGCAVGAARRPSGRVGRAAWLRGRLLLPHCCCCCGCCRCSILSCHVIDWLPNMAEAVVDRSRSMDADNDDVAANYRRPTSNKVSRADFGLGVGGCWRSAAVGFLDAAIVCVRASESIIWRRRRRRRRRREATGRRSSRVARHGCWTHRRWCQPTRSLCCLLAVECLALWIGQLS